VNVEEGRHLWAIVYLLFAHFGRDGREEAEELLQRRSCDPDKPRILGAFNELCADWLSFFMNTFFMDRDGKFQLLALAESAFDPLSRTTRFMLTEEAHHMFVGETGIQRIVDRTAQQMRERGQDHPDDLRKLGLIDLPTVQRYLDFWYSVALDLFGGEISSNAAASFATGIKGRAGEEAFPDHRALEGTYPVELLQGGALVRQDVPMRNALNEVLRDAYVEDCQRGVDRWNRTIEGHGIPFRLRLPSRRFRRRIGVHAGAWFDPEGKPVTEAEWKARQDEWLPSPSDLAFVSSLMQRPVLDPRELASWIGPPRQGVKGRPVDFEYVRRGEA
jgi:benzoyl-CoA 2,3-dioxygenase component B